MSKSRNSNPNRHSIGWTLLCGNCTGHVLDPQALNLIAAMIRSTHNPVRGLNVLYDGLPVRRNSRRTGSPSYRLVAAVPH